MATAEQKNKVTKWLISENILRAINPSLSIKLLILNDKVLKLSICFEFQNHEKWGQINFTDEHAFIYLVNNNVKVFIVDENKRSQRSTSDILYEHLNVKTMTKEQFADLVERSKDRVVRRLVDNEIKLISTFPKVFFNDL